MSDYIDDDQQIEVDAGEVEQESNEQEQHQEDDHQQESGYVETDDPKVKERLGRLTREKHEALRRERKAADEARQLREELQKLKAPKPVEPPSADLAIDDPSEYARQQSAYVEHVKQQAVFDQQKKQLEDQSAQQKNEAKQAAAMEYTKRAQQLKIEPQALQQSAALLSQAGISEDLEDYLLRHEQGPKLVVELAANPDLLYEIVELSPVQAAARLERLSIRKNNPPPPPTRVNGSRSSGTRDNDGTTFE